MLSCKFIVLLMCVSCCVSKGLYGFRNKRPTRNYLDTLCSNLVVTDTSVCKHGADDDNQCKILACLKGTDELCDDEGQEVMRFGKCAKGLMCYCNKCSGCIGGNCKQELCAEADYYFNNMLRK